MYFTNKRNYEHFEFNKQNGTHKTHSNKKRSLPSVPMRIGVNNDDDYDLNYLSSLKLPDLPTTINERRQQRVDFVRREMRYQQMPQWDFSVPKGIQDYMRNPNKR